MNRHLLLPLLLAAALAGGPPGEAEAGPDGPTVVVRPLRGEASRGPLESLGAEAAVLGGPAGSNRFDLGRVLEIRTDPSPSSHAPEGAHLRVHLVGGETLVGTLAEGREVGIVLATPSAGPVLLPYEIIRTLVAVPPDAGRCYEPEARFLPRDDVDVLYLDNGDTNAGLLLAIDAEGFRLEGEGGGERRLGWDGASVLHLVNEVPAAPEGLRVEVESADGARWACAAPPTMEDGALRFALRSSPTTPVALPLDQVVAVRPSGGAFVYACHLPFESTLETPYGGEAEDPIEARFRDTWFGTRVDRRPSGCPLTLAGTIHRHGFAVQSRSVVTIPLDAAFSTFECLFGVDDEALGPEGGGIVDARVLVDGKEAWAAAAGRAGEAPRRVGPLEVAGAATLVLEVDFGPELHVRDRATWADPVLVR